MARTFNGSSAYVSAASIPGNIGSNSRSIAFYFNKTGGGRGFVYIEGDETATYSRFAVDADGGQLKFNRRSDDFVMTTYSDNSLHHIVVTFNGTTVQGYKDGAAVTGNSSMSAINTLGAGFNIGRYYSGALYFTGHLSMVAKWNIALTAADVTALYASRGNALFVRPESLAFYAPLVRDVIDYKGLALTDTATTVSDHPRFYQ